jgi:glycerophosphoryl diester phosphodiesterase
MLELDVFMTTDNQVVVSHDNQLLRLTGEEVELNTLTFAALPHFQAHIPSGHFSPAPADCSAGRFALLSDVFAQFPSTPIHLEIKQYTTCTACVKATGTLIQQHNREHITIWGSFSGSVTAECATLFPTIPRYTSLVGTVKLLFLFYSGLLGWLPMKEACKQSPLFCNPHPTGVA